MKRIVEVPDELYRKAKTRAAAQKREINDLVAEGLRALLKSPPQDDGKKLDDAKQRLLALDKIRRYSPTPSDRSAMLQAEARKLRMEVWSRSDLAQ